MFCTSIVQQRMFLAACVKLHLMLLPFSFPFQVTVSYAAFVATTAFMFGHVCSDRAEIGNSDLHFLSNINHVEFIPQTVFSPHGLRRHRVERDLSKRGIVHPM